jgi:hypothetical protein
VAAALGDVLGAAAAAAGGAGGVGAGVVAVVVVAPGVVAATRCGAPTTRAAEWPARVTTSTLTRRSAGLPVAWTCRLAASG